MNGGLTVGKVFHGLRSGQLQSADGFLLPEQYADSPVSCNILRLTYREHFNQFLLVSRYKTLWDLGSTSNLHFTAVLFSQLPPEMPLMF